MSEDANQIFSATVAEILVQSMQGSFDGFFILPLDLFTTHKYFMNFHGAIMNHA